MDIMSTTLPPVTLPHTEEHRLQPAHTNHEYVIQVALPTAYASSGKNDPTIYVLDPIMYFGTVVEITRTLKLFEELPEVIVVGIGYPIDNITASMAYRCREQARLLLSTAINGTNPEAKQTAIDIINRLGARGILEFMDLIK